MARRMGAWADRYAEKWSIVAPVPFFPRLPFKTRWAVHSSVPGNDTYRRSKVLHPRYPMIPGLFTRFQGAAMGLFSLGSVRRLVEEEGPFDLMDSHYVYPDGYAAAYIAEKLSLPLVITARGTDINLYPSLPGILQKVRRVFNACDASIAVSEPLARRIRELSTSDANSPTYIIPNGVDLDSFRPDNDARAAQPKPIVLAAGNLVPEKGFDMLIQAIACLVPDYPGISLQIAGEGPERGGLTELAISLKIEKHITFLGRVPHEQLPCCYRAAGLFCLASSREGCPNVVLEAFASGIPVVATSVGGIPDLVVDGVNGFQVTPRTPEALAQVIHKVLQSSWSPWKIRATIHNRSWNRVADEVQNVFTGVLDSRACQSDKGFIKSER